MTYAISDFRARFPEFAGQGDPQIQALVDEAKLQITEKVWTDWYKMGINYFVAHYLAISKAQSQGDDNNRNPILNMGAGRVTVQQQAAEGKTDSEIFFGSTSYGQEYLRLRNIVGIGAGQTGAYVTGLSNYDT